VSQSLHQWNSQVWLGLSSCLRRILIVEASRFGENRRAGQCLVLDDLEVLKFSLRSLF